jgi:cysteine desulfurase
VRIYLDHNATTPLRPEVRDVVVEALGRVGNPSSAHREGAAARRMVEDARAHVAALINAAAAEIVFTSGATEANNLAFQGAGRRRARLVVTAVEHASVLEPARALEAAGHVLVVVPVDAAGRPEVPRVVEAAEPGDAFVSVGLANGELGCVAPVAAIAAALRARDVTLHTDAAQAGGRIPIDVRTLGVDLLSLSSHKLGGPMGTGALWVRAGANVEACVTGGPQERGRRAGTENVAAIAGFGAAARLARQGLADAIRLAALRERLWAGIHAAVPDAIRNGPHGEPALPNTLNVTVPGVAGESLLVRLDLDGVAASLGSACAAGAAEPSHVLRAIGRDADAARNGLRLSLGPATTGAEIDRTFALVAPAVARIRAVRAA